MKFNYMSGMIKQIGVAFRDSAEDKSRQTVRGTPRCKIVNRSETIKLLKQNGHGLFLFSSSQIIHNARVCNKQQLE